MASPKHALLAELEKIEGLSSQPSRVAGGTALFFQGKEIAHFHHDRELDLRLTRKVIKELGLVHPERSTVHPKRATSSQWIEVRYESPSDVSRVVELVRLAVAQV
jgi:hypothetical protein